MDATPVLDPNKVPEILRPAIPYAQRWGYEETFNVNDDFWLGKEKWLAMLDTLRFAATHDIPAMENARLAIGPRNRVSDDMLEEYDALTMFFMRLEEIGMIVSGKEKYRLLGYLEESEHKPDVLINRFLLRDAQMSMTDHVITLEMSAWMMNDERRPFTLRLLDVRKVELESKIGSALTLKEWLTYAFTLRWPEEFIFPERRHCHIDTDRFLLKAEYGEVEIEKDW
jgi:hypothetical protein